MKHLAALILAAALAGCAHTAPRIAVAVSGDYQGTAYRVGYDGKTITTDLDLRGHNLR